MFFLNAIGQNIKALKIEHWHSKSKSWTTYQSLLTSKKSRLQFNFHRLFGYVFMENKLKPWYVSVVSYNILNVL